MPAWSPLVVVDMDLPSRVELMDEVSAMVSLIEAWSDHVMVLMSVEITFDKSH